MKEMHSLLMYRNHNHNSSTPEIQEAMEQLQALDDRVQSDQTENQQQIREMLEVVKQALNELPILIAANQLEDVR